MRTAALLLWACAPALGAAAPAPSVSSSAAIGLSYEQAVQEGLRNNLDLMAAKYGIPLAEADEVTAGLWNNPSLTADTIFHPFSFTKNYDQTSAAGPRQYDLQIGYPFDLSGKIRSARKSAHQATRVAQTAFDDAVRQKLRDIRLAYIDVLVFGRQLDLAQEKEQDLQQLVSVIENRIGSGGRLPLLRLRAQLARDQASLDRRQRGVALRSAQTALAVILGRSDGARPEPTTPLRQFEMPEPASLQSLTALALESRPDLQALRLALEKTRLDRDLARAQRLDNVVVTYGLSTQGPIDANPDDPATRKIPRGNSFDASVTLPLPIFNRNQGNIRKAELTEAQVQKQIAALELATRQEIASVYDQLLLNRALLLDYEKRQLPNARRVRDEQQKLVGMGSSSLLDYFDALNAYTSAVSAYYDIVGEYRRNVARLDAACAREVLP